MNLENWEKRVASHTENWHAPSLRSVLLGVLFVVFFWFWFAQFGWDPSPWTDWSASVSWVCLFRCVGVQLLLFIAYIFKGMLSSLMWQNVTNSSFFKTLLMVTTFMAQTFILCHKSLASYEWAKGTIKLVFVASWYYFTAFLKNKIQPICGCCLRRCAIWHLG